MAANDPSVLMSDAPDEWSAYLKDRIFLKIKAILDKNNRSDLLDLTYTVVKELVVNASKGLMKRIFFAEQNLNIDDPAQWEKGTSLFKEQLREERLKEYLFKAHSLNFKVRVRYVYNRDGMSVEVINNTPIPAIDEKRMRQKLGSAMKFDSLADFYTAHADNLEGAGIGLAFIIIMLKNQGFDPQYLRIGNQDEETVGRVEIPFSANYVPIRERKYQTMISDSMENQSVEI
jgi:hypothetical protein